MDEPLTTYSLFTITYSLSSRLSSFLVSPQVIGYSEQRIVSKIGNRSFGGPFSTYSLFTITYSLMVEVAGVEPASETASPERLRVYCAIGLGCGMPTHGLIRIHPLGSAPCGGRAEPPAAWSAKLCLGAQQASALRHGGLCSGGQGVIVVRNYCFFPFFNVANENPRRATRPRHIPSKPDHPQSC